MDTGELFFTPALVDCRATGQFMDIGFVRRNYLTTKKLTRAIPVFNAQRVQTRAAVKRLLECHWGLHPAMVEEVEDEEDLESKVKDKSSSEANDDTDPVALEDDFEGD
ncbi:hypothetical protein M422DRAFT_262498 [Sphaerobolus stellatus SS14]|uniref:Uncharacterized protein n=1 Tax=Sphaerobolus stellatus (strain SS14) TaxID=990650 RepID=A0A0C9VCS9_SPHS4|nr:hypothetical protein M422DRAFT_262498 [Sphaerobolus stellatus SS14]